MFKKLLLKILKSLSPEEKKSVREFLEDKQEPELEEVNGEDVIDEEKSETVEKEGKENEDMENIKKDEEIKKQDDGEVEKVEEVEEKENAPEMENQTAEPEQPPVVQDVEPVGNGISIDDLVTKDELTERFAALEAKFEAVVKENQDLKNKYEEKDFGNFQKKGINEKEKTANSTFEEYLKQFNK